MSRTGLDATRARLLEALADLCARQWAALGGAAGPLGQPPCRSIIDPEALVLASFPAREVDPRLEERVAWWGRTGARYTSVQRMRSMVRLFPTTIESDFHAFAKVASSHGRGSWRAHAKGGETLRGRVVAESHEPSLAAASALMLKLRVGFGVNARPDLLAFLLGSDGSFSASAIARMLVCSEATTKRAAADMARAGLIHEYHGHPTVYAADREAWARLLELDAGVPPWRPWPAVVTFVVHGLEWASGPSRSAYLRSSAARDLLDSLDPSRAVLARAGLEPPRPERAPGEALEEVFLEFLRTVAGWMVENA